MRELQAMPHAITVSDVRGSVDVDGNTPLLWVLRDILGMTGTKFGCGMALRRVHAGRKIQEAWLNFEEQRNERVSVVGQAVQRT
jgi:aerobic-type carbon monoxide dehydrogenase small subunit (CoxS/CutS family)